MWEGRKLKQNQSLLCALVFAICLFLPIRAGAATIVPANTTITTSTVWTVVGSPYVLRDGGQVNVMGTLTIEPGVIVETASFGGIYVSGAIHINGTEELPVIFQSIRGNPNPGDYGGIYFDHAATSTISYTTFLDGGLFIGRDPDTHIQFVQRSVVTLDTTTVVMDHVIIDQAFDTGLSIFGTSTLQMDHSTIRHSIGGIDAYNNTSIEFHNNSFVSTTSYALRANGNGVIDATRNWWGDDSGPYPVGRGGTVAVSVGRGVNPSVQYDPWIGSRDPVILIPGILGSELKGDGVNGVSTIWPNPLSMLISPDDGFMDALQMNENGSPGDNSVTVGDIIRNINVLVINEHIFDRLIDQFHQYDYVDGRDLYVFPYDWRLDIRVNSSKLAEFIASHTAGSAKVDIVAHSMGGLLVKQYLLDHPNTQKVDTIVFVGTPHLGAPKAAKMLLVGDDIDTYGLLNPGEIKKIGRNMASVYELLPGRQYFLNQGTYVEDYSQTNSSFNYDQTVEFLKNQSLNTALIDNADAFHSSELDNLSFSRSINVFNISGCKNPTIGKIIKRNSNIYASSQFTTPDVNEFMLSYVSGDGTVPLISSEYANIPQSHQFYTTSTKHGELPSGDGVRSTIVDIIRHPQLDFVAPINILKGKENCSLNGETVSVHSPVNIHVYDEAGNHVGLNASGTIDLGIPGVSYDNFDGNKFVFLPTNSNVHYRVELEATATGTFNMRVSDVRDSIPTQTSYYNAVPIVTASRAHVDLSTDTTTDHTVVDLKFDHTGTDHFETIPVTSILDATTTLDFIKPTTTVMLTDLSTSSTLSTWTRWPVTVSLSATDDMSGVLRTEYSLDNGATWQTYDAPFTIVSENTSVLYRSIDLAGNMEEAKSIAIPIDTTPPEIEVSFDTSTMDYRIGGVDTLASTTVSLISTNTFKVVDMAYNATTVSLFTASTTNNTGYFTRILQMNSIQKNSGETQMPIKNQLFTQWQVSSTGTLLWLQEAMQVKNNFYIIAKYNAQTYETIWWKKNTNGSLLEIERFVGQRLPIVQSSDIYFIYY